MVNIPSTVSAPPVNSTLVLAFPPIVPDIKLMPAPVIPPDASKVDVTSSVSLSAWSIANVFPSAPCIEKWTKKLLLVQIAFRGVTRSSSVKVRNWLSWVPWATVWTVPALSTDENAKMPATRITIPKILVIMILFVVS